jgi:thioredoxin reductase
MKSRLFSSSSDIPEGSMVKDMEEIEQLPVAVIGAGPVGLAAAARLVERELEPLIFEKGATAGTSLASWAHVRVFSPWEFNIDASASALLAGTDWTSPDLNALPTGGEIVREYLAPLAGHPAIAPHMAYNATVTAITRSGHDKVVSEDREAAPFVIRWRDGAGRDQRSLARAVIDASGTWDQPNPMGIDGLPVPGEHDAGYRIAYGIPDVFGRERDIYSGRRVLVVGSGHSAINAALALLSLQAEAPQTRISWALRRNRINKLLGGGLNDQLPERGALGLAAKRALDENRLEMLAPFAAERIDRNADALTITARIAGETKTLEVDRIIVATGLRPDLEVLREIRVALDPAMEAPTALAPLIDPNLHSCGTVPPHGAAELAHPEPGFFIVGSKSYGRAPTFLMATGYEQVRSVVAEIAGDREAARQTQLVLPETGVCNGPEVPGEATASGCCGGPAPVGVQACCRADADAKDAGLKGCGCSDRAAADTPGVPA